MANMRAIRSRIKSIQSTGQLTKSMKTVSASKLRRTQSAMQSLRPFSDACREMLAAVIAGGGAGDNELLRPRGQTGKVCFVLFVGNRGLCGAYNTQLFHYAKKLAEDNGEGSFFVVCGRWGREQLASTGVPVKKVFDALPDTPDSADAAAVTEYLKALYLDGEADRIELVYEQFKNVIVQIPAVRTLLPMTEPEGSSADEYIFEPDRASLINSLTELYIANSVYSVMLEARTGEHAARMTAMSAASDNTDELVSKLSLELNRARQAAITTELSEVAGGAAAMDNFRG